MYILYKERLSIGSKLSFKGRDLECWTEDKKSQELSARKF